MVIRKKKSGHAPAARRGGATGGRSAVGATGGLSASAATLTDWLRPWLLGGACALFVARPLFPSEAAAYQGDGLPVVMLWIVLGVLWLLGAIGRPQFHVRFGWTDAAVLALIGWHTIAAVWAAMHVSPRPAVNMLWEWIGLGLSFFLARQLIVGQREARAVVAVMIALAVALSGYGLYQCFHELPATRAMYEADPEAALRAARLAYESDSPERQMFEDRLESTEPYATFALANSLAGYLAPWLVVLAGVAVSTFENRAVRLRIWPIVAVWMALISCGGLIAFCLLLTKSRSAWVALILGVLGVTLMLFRMLWRELAGRFGWKLGGARVLAAAIIIVAVLLLAAGVLIGAGVAVGGLDRQVLSEASKSLGYRVQYWQSTLRVIADHPLLGCGPGNFQEAYTAYKLPEASEEVADPHNFLLEVWATAGTPAVLALVAVLGCFAWASSIFNSQFSIFNFQLPERPHPSPLPEGEGTADLPTHVFGGAGCGFLLAVSLGLMSAAPPGLTAVLLGLPLAAVCVASLAGWVYGGRMPAVLPAIGVVVLLVNLLAAGGIGFPSVAGSLWLLMALGLNTAAADRPSWTLPRISAPAVLVVAVALAVACYASGYGPVLTCQGELWPAREASAQGNLAAAERHLLAAAKADPLAAEPWHHLIAVAASQWRQKKTPGTLWQLDQYLDRYDRVLGELAPNSSRAWLADGELHEEVYSAAGRRGDIQSAIGAYSRAVALYPNSGLYRARLALAHEAAGDLRAFRDQADWALRLDDETPHADKKLPPDLRRRLVRGTRLVPGTRLAPEKGPD